MGTLSSELGPLVERIATSPRVYADANMPARRGRRSCATRLGWDVLFVHRARRPAPRPRHRALTGCARQLGRTLVTLDRDYLDDRQFPLTKGGRHRLLRAGRAVAPAPARPGWIASCSADDRTRARCRSSGARWSGTSMLSLGLDLHPERRRVRAVVIDERRRRRSRARHRRRRRRRPSATPPRGRARDRRRRDLRSAARKSRRVARHRACDRALHPARRRSPPEAWIGAARGARHAVCLCMSATRSSPGSLLDGRPWSRRAQPRRRCRLARAQSGRARRTIASSEASPRKSRRGHRAPPLVAHPGGRPVAGPRAAPAGRSDAITGAARVRGRARRRRRRDLGRARHREATSAWRSRRSRPRSIPRSSSSAAASRRRTSCSSPSARMRAPAAARMRCTDLRVEFSTLGPDAIAIGAARIA